MDNWHRDLEHAQRTDAEESEFDAAKLAARTRDLGDVAFESMTGGDLVMVRSYDRSYAGSVRHAHGDLASIQIAGGSVDANLAGPLHLVVRHYAYSDGVDRTPGPRTFKARLSEFELTGETVEIVAPAAGASLQGHIAAVARDHVMLATDDGLTAFIPLAEIAFVVRHTREGPA